jgi:hypothetical protein
MKNIVYPLIVLLCIAFQAQSNVYNFQTWVSPSNPLPGDEVFLIASYQTSTPCVVGSHTLNLSGNSFLAHWNFHDLACDGWMCLMVIVDVVDTISLGQLNPGSYNISVSYTQDNYGCVGPQLFPMSPHSFVVMNPANIVASSQTNTLQCNGDSNGTINLSVSGGDPPYQFLWSTGQSTEDLSGLAAGAYTVTISDFNGDLLEHSALISEPTAVQQSYVLANPCFEHTNGSIQVMASGGSPPYVFLWSNGQWNPTISGLAPGNYSLTVSDSHNCKLISSFSLNQNPLIENASTITHVDCFGAASGAIQCSLSGGTPPFTYLWSNGFQGQNLSSIVAGSYSFTATDDNGCLKVNVFSVGQPSELLISEAITNVNPCNGDANGSIQLSVSGGTPSLSMIIWSNASTSLMNNNLPAGFYSVTITDQNNCQKSEGFTVLQPEAILITGQLTFPSSGNNGAIELSVQGGLPPYAFQWNNGAHTQNIQNLEENQYSVTVTDALGCQKVQAFQLVITESGFVNVPVSWLIYDALSREIRILRPNFHSQNPAQFSVTSASGQTILKFPVHSQVLSLSTQGWKTGLYLFNVSDGKSVPKRAKVFIQAE